jgi:cytochrome P450
MSASTKVVSIAPTLFGSFRALRRLVRNPMEAWPEAVYREKLVITHMFGRQTLFVTDPDMVQQVLVDDSDSFVKAEPMRRALEPGLGQAILTAEGTRWRMQRRVAAPVFRPGNVDGFVPAMIAAARAMRAQWAALPDGTKVDVPHEMMQVTFDIILETMLSGRGDIDVAAVDRSMRDFLESTSWAVALSALGAPLWTPFPGKRRAERAHRYLRQMVAKRVDERRHTGERRDDLLSLMLDAKDPETGEGLSDTSIRDNILTFVAAGHETTALALTWTFYLLSRHPDIEQRVLHEIDQVTGGAPLEAQNVPLLTYTRQVVMESMRVYPPVAMVVRQPTRDMVIGGVTVKPETNVFIPIYAIHHHELLWNDPDVFDPDRFAPEAVKARHRWSYLPFSAGPRICIGMGFALIEAVAILGTLLPAVRLEAPPDFVPTPKLRVTMRPKEGMVMEKKARKEESMFFFEKKNQKTFVHLGASADTDAFK